MFDRRGGLHAFLALSLVGGVSIAVDVSTGKIATKNKQTGFVSVPPERIKQGRLKLAGDRSANDSEARKSWHRRCENWLRKVQRDLVNERLLMITCSSPTCTGSAPSRSCSSNGIYKFTDKPKSEVSRTASRPSQNSAWKRK